MTSDASLSTVDDLTSFSAVRIEELVNRKGLDELAASTGELYGVLLRIFGSTGALLAGNTEPPQLQVYIGTRAGGRRALRRVVESIKAIEHGDEAQISTACPSGAHYAVSGISYDKRSIGRIVVGPYLPIDLTEPPEALFSVDSDLDGDRLRTLWSQLARVDDAAVRRLIRHLKTAIDLILFSGHRALLASNMHLASVRESYRELQEKTASLQTAYERLQELDRLKSNFLGTVSHELRTPLTSIIGYSEMLTAGIVGEMTAEQQEFINTIHEKGAQLLDLIGGLLDLTKLESGTLNIRKSEVPVGPLLDDIVQTLTPQARRKKVALLAQYEADLPELWGEPTRLRQVLQNLVENGIKFTPEGGTVRLSANLVHRHMTADEEGPAVVMRGMKRAMIELRVADTGIGISEADRERVFDAFYQVDSSSTRSQGGTGLGLSIVKRLVSAHDGVVHVEKGDPSGSVFVVLLPCRKTTMIG